MRLEPSAVFHSPEGVTLSSLRVPDAWILSVWHSLSPVGPAVAPAFHSTLSSAAGRFRTPWCGPILFSRLLGSSSWLITVLFIISNPTAFLQDLKIMIICFFLLWLLCFPLILTLTSLFQPLVVTCLNRFIQIWKGALWKICRGVIFVSGYENAAGFPTTFSCCILKEKWDIDTHPCKTPFVKLYMTHLLKQKRQVCTVKVEKRE